MIKLNKANLATIVGLGACALGVGSSSYGEARQPRLEDSYRVVEKGRYGDQVWKDAEEHFCWGSIVHFDKVVIPIRYGVYEIPLPGDKVIMVNEATGDTLNLYVSRSIPKIEAKKDRARIASIADQPIGFTAEITPDKIKKFSQDDNDFVESETPIYVRNRDGIRFERRPKLK